MGNATSMFNLMRNLGGSVGIAGATTYLFRRQQFHTHMLGTHVTPYSSQTRNYLSGVQNAMVAHGIDPATAAHQSYGSLWGMVQQQASMISFVDTFRAMAVVFLLVLPLLLLMRKPKHQGRPTAMH